MAMKRLFMDEEAVSEVLGAILTLLVTVALFTSVFATVQQLEGPDGELHVEFESEFENSGGTNYINVTHLGGKRLDADSLNFFLMLGDDEIPDDDLEIVLPNEDDTLWSVEEKVSIRYEGGIDDTIDDTLELMIREDDTYQIVYQTMLLDDRNILDIRNARIDYELDWRNYAEPGEEIEIKALMAAPVWQRFDDFDPENIDMTASIFESGVLESEDPNGEIEIEYTRENRFERKLNVSEGARDDRYRIKITAEYDDEDIDIDPEYLYLNIGKEPISYYEEKLGIGSVRFDPRSPSHGDSFTLFVEVFNEGVKDCPATWNVTDDRHDGMELSDEKNIAHGPAPTLITVNYPEEGIQGHGPHEISFEIEPDLEDWEGDSWKETVYVDPNVMLVRDHLHQDIHEGEFMENALGALNLDHDIYSVEPGEKIEDLDEEISQYSVAIWMVGNKTEEEPYIMDEDVLETLNDYVEGGLDESPLNGALWLMGSNLAHFDEGDFGDLNDKIGVEGFEGDPAPFDEERILFDPTGDENGTYGDFEYGVSDGEFTGISGIKNEEENNTLVYKDKEDDDADYLGVGYEAEEKQRTAVNPFMFGSITDPGQRAIMAGEVIRWLSNITTRAGLDVSVVSQSIDPVAPMFMDEITINATLRNNGPEDLHVSVRAVRNQGEEILTPDGEDSVFLPKNGGVNETSFTWEANELGRHEFLVVADYFNEVDEANVRNNDITYKNLDITDDDTEVNVHFSTLLVDADGSDYENGDYRNVTAEVKDSFERLGHEKDVDYTYHRIGEDEDGDLEDGPGEDEMKNYNAIVWVTGEREDELFNTTHVDNINSYLGQESGANMMFIGEHILEDVDNSTLKNYLGVEDSNGKVNSDLLLGQRDSDLGHGLRYKIEEESYSSFDEPNEHGEVLFKDREGNNLASTYDDGKTRTVYMGVNLNRIEGPLVDEGEFEDWPVGEVNTSSENAREEFIYTSFWNFGKGDDRTELRVTDYDIKLSSDNPQTGRSYQINARIENLGYSGASALVRVREGNDHVASQSPFVEGSERSSEAANSYFDVSPGSTTIEVSWDPMDGGMRPIRVRVDPLRSVDEIESDGEEGLNEKIMEFNNQARIEHPVYYFYDDMERGDDKWSHDSTMINIDGSSPLDFMSAADTDHTDVKSDWDWNYSGSTTSGADGDIKTYSGEGEGVYNTRDPDVNEFTDNASYSPPRSYWMAEGVGDPEAGDRKPLDLVLLFDEGKSMQSDWDDVVAAAEAAIDFLSPGDRAAIYSSTGAAVHENINLVDGTITEDSEEQDKQAIKDAIPNKPKARQKGLIVGASEAILELDNNGRDEAVKGIITITDGASNQDQKDSKYSPGGGSEDDQKGPVQWYDGPENPEGKKGVLGIPYNVMTLTISDTIEPRHHWISATSTANVSYGILERNTNKLKKLYKMFVRDLSQTERGDLRSIPEKDLDLAKSSVGDDSSTALTNNGGVVENTEFFVYSDAFTTGWLDDEVPYDWDSGDRIPSYDKDDRHYTYDQFEFEYTTEKGIKDTQGDDWVVVESDTQGDKIANTVYPRDTIDRLEGDYEVKGAYANMFIQTSSKGQGDEGSIKLKITQDGTELFEQTGITGDDEYININIPEISNSEAFDFTLQHEGGGNVVLDDLSFTYEIDYYPEDHEYDQEVGTNRTYRYMTTPSVEVGDTDDLNSATLEFQNRYKLTEGTAGGFIYLWGKDEDEDDWSWGKDNRLYVEPEQSYTGNLNLARIDEHNDEGGPRLTGDTGAPYLEDTKGNLPYWVFNGKSADRTFDWRYTSVDLGRHEEFLDKHEEVRAVFMLSQFGGITREDDWTPDMGWYVDNVRFKLSSEWNSTGPSYWDRVSANELDSEMGIDNVDTSQYLDRHDEDDGKYWMFTSRDDEGNDILPEGVDSSLYTHPIHLENAEDPRLSAYMKFNIDDSAGLPPDGFRVEVSDDDGRTWNSLTYGARSAWNASGTDAASGEAYSGTTENESSDDYGWVDSSTLHRLSADLSGWRGETIRLRFRVFTNKTEMYDDPELPKAIFIDDVVVAEADMMENAENPSETTTVFEEDFAGHRLETEWETDDWERSDTNHAGGEAPEVRLNWEDLEGDHAYLTGPTFDTTALSELKLNLRSHIEPFSDGGFDAKVLIRSDPDEEWTSIEPWENPITETLDADMYEIEIKDHIGPETQLKFEFDGESWYLEDWFVNELSLEGKASQESESSIQSMDKVGEVDETEDSEMDRVSFLTSSDVDLSPFQTRYIVGDAYMMKKIEAEYV